ncbi:hypothetical protein [Ferrimonas marina]|uniref:hypothetical protein n=1 Tax=Ferrimonas marina TaxID=299255 RepID=UPI00116154E0|nr:hypothetical protein [Ferrimonas marina]
MLSMAQAIAGRVGHAKQLEASGLIASYILALRERYKEGEAEAKRLNDHLRLPTGFFADKEIQDALKAQLEATARSSSLLHEKLIETEQAIRRHLEMKSKHEDQLAEVLRSGQVASVLSTVKVTGVGGKSLKGLMAEPAMAEIRDLVTRDGPNAHGMKLESERSLDADGSAAHVFVLVGNLSQVQRFCERLRHILYEGGYLGIEVDSMHVAGIPKMEPKPAVDIPDRGDNGAFVAGLKRFVCYRDVTGVTHQRDLADVVARAGMECLAPLARFLPKGHDYDDPAIKAPGYERDLMDLRSVVEKARGRGNEVEGLDR